jgi:steroid delta-isomerase-like uncharacterized protein
MSVEQNKEITRRLIEEVFNRGNFAIVNEIVAPNFVEHEELPPGIPNNQQAVAEMSRMLRSAFPDFKATIKDLIAEGNKVALFMTWTGTQKGEFMGLPPSDKHMNVSVFDILRFEGGQICEHWGAMDSLGMMQQLGAIPAPKHA